jgi:hypothetical protein
LAGSEELASIRRWSENLLAVSIDLEATRDEALDDVCSPSNRDVVVIVAAAPAGAMAMRATREARRDRTMVVDYNFLLEWAHGKYVLYKA